MRKSTFSKILLALGLVVIFALPQNQTTLAAPAQPRANLKIALLGPMSGDLASFGVSMQQGAQLAVAQWNAKGGAAGQTVELQIEDTQCGSGPAAVAATKVSTEGIHYILGDVCSGASIAISQIAEANHILQISPTSTNAQVTLNPDGSVKPYVFRACFIDPFQGKMMARFARQHGYQNAFILKNLDDPYSTGLAEAFEAAFLNAGGNVIASEPYRTSDSDLSAIINKMKDYNPDVVYLPDSAGRVITTLTQARDAGVTATFMGGDSWATNALNATIAQGSFFSNHFSAADTRPIVQTFVQQYASAYSSAVPDAIAALSYDATNLLLQAIQTAGGDDPALVKDRLAQIQWDAVTGHITFDVFHNPNKAIVVVQVKDALQSFFASFIQYDLFLPQLRK